MLMDVSATFSGLQSNVRDSVIRKACGSDQTVSVCDYFRNRMELARVYHVRNVSRAKKHTLVCSNSTKDEYQKSFFPLNSKLRK